MACTPARSTRPDSRDRDGSVDLETQHAAVEVEGPTRVLNSTLTWSMPSTRSLTHPTPSALAATSPRACDQQPPIHSLDPVYSPASHAEETAPATISNSRITVVRCTGSRVAPNCTASVAARKPLQPRTTIPAQAPAEAVGSAWPPRARPSAAMSSTPSQEASVFAVTLTACRRRVSTVVTAKARPAVSPNQSARSVGSGSPIAGRRASASHRPRPSGGRPRCAAPDARAGRPAPAPRPTPARGRTAAARAARCPRACRA